MNGAREKGLPERAGKGRDLSAATSTSAHRPPVEEKAASGGKPGIARNNSRTGTELKE